MEIINSYDKLPLGIYLDIFDLIEDKELEDDDRQMQIISLLSGRSVNDLLKMPILEFKRLAAQTRFLEEEMPSPTRKAPKQVRLGDMVLNVTTDFTKMTTAQYVDFQTFSAEGRSKMVEMLSCFFIPKGMDYNEGYDILEVHDILRTHLSVTDAMSMTAFFLKSLKDLTQATIIYLRWLLKGMKDQEMRLQMEKKINLLQTALDASGDGLTLSSVLWRLPIRRGMTYGG